MNLVMVPMWIFSGIFFSSERFPEAIQPLIKAIPLTPLIDSLRAVMLEGAPLAAQAVAHRHHDRVGVDLVRAGAALVPLAVRCERPQAISSVLAEIERAGRRGGRADRAEISCDIRRTGRKRISIVVASPPSRSSSKSLEPIRRSSISSR